MSYELSEARQLVIKAGLELVKNGLIARTWGNISARISDTQFVITPSGRSYDSLIPEDIVIVNIKDCSYEGEIKPSGEVATHAVAYREKPDVNFVIHTHQVYASAISIMAEDLENIETYNTSIDNSRQNYEQILSDTIPVAKYAICCTDALAKNVRNCIRKNPESRSLFLKSHGVLCMGESYEDAFLLVETTEEVCENRYNYLMSSFLETADRAVDSDFGTSYRKDGYIYLTVDGKDASWPVGYAAKSKRSDVPRSIRGIAMLHDTLYQDINVNYIEHVKSPFINTISKLGKSIRPYIDDQAQIIGIDVKNIGIRMFRNKLRRISRIEKAAADHSAILIKTGGAIIMGSSEDDIVASSMVLEKGCMAAVIAHLIPTIKPLPKKAATHMRNVYRDSYSKLKDYAITAATLKDIDQKVEAEKVIPYVAPQEASAVQDAPADTPDAMDSSHNPENQDQTQQN